MDFLHYSYFEVTLAVSQEIEVSPSGLNVPVNITKVLSQPFLQAFAGLANVLFATPSSPTADCVDQVTGVTVSLSVQVNSMVDFFGFESGPWLDVVLGLQNFACSLHNKTISTSYQNKIGEQHYPIFRRAKGGILNIVLGS